MVSKTREKLIDVARQLFAHKGIDNTTMNDIANASDKGRRTIYTYFKNKREIYNAVIERESDQIVAELKRISEDKQLCPKEKLKKYLSMRCNHSATSASLYDSLKQFFSRDYKRVDRIRKLAYEKESVIFEHILEEGVTKGDFNREQVQYLKVFLPKLLQGMDLIGIDDENDEANRIEFAENLINFTLAGILEHHRESDNSMN
jgi:AcrR family transcriptional regulator